MSGQSADGAARDAVSPDGTETTRRLPPDLQKQAFLRGAISAFLLFHLIVISCWALPINFTLLRDVREIVRPYMLWSGLFQSWDFFAPNPKSINSYIEAIVITRDHRQHVWVFPRMRQLGYARRYRKERYRKFAQILPLRKNAYLWSGVAQHVAGMFDDPADPPEMVLLVEFSAPIQPGASSSPVLKPKIFYEYVAGAAVGGNQ